jgi:hypothetical protein
MIFLKENYVKVIQALINESTTLRFKLSPEKLMIDFEIATKLDFEKIFHIHFIFHATQYRRLICNKLL